MDQIDSVKDLNQDQNPNLDYNDDHAYQICRICLQNEHPSTQAHHPNPLLTPCQCKGTSSFVHEQCMIKWIHNSKWRQVKDSKGTYILCQLCLAPIYFDIGSESWCSWCRSKPCSAVFYLTWVLLLMLSFCAIVGLAVYATVTKEYEILRFLGLPLGFFVFGGFLFYHCGKSFRDYETNIVTIKSKSKIRNDRKCSESNLKVHQSQKQQQQ